MRVAPWRREAIFGCRTTYKPFRGLLSPSGARNDGAWFLAKF
jgi:hypothetical protein